MIGRVLRQFWRPKPTPPGDNRFAATYYAARNAGAGHGEALEHAEAVVRGARMGRIAVLPDPRVARAARESGAGYRAESLATLFGRRGRW